jgi:PilZ domain
VPNRSTHPVAALAEKIELDGAERRAEARYPTQDPVEIEILPGPGDPLYGTLLDVSRSGLRLALRKRIGRGEQVKIQLHRNVILGEVRYCRSVPDGFQVGVRIKDLVRPPGWKNEHIGADPLSFYAVGRGLSIAEVIEIREHLAQCEACDARLAQQEALLNPSTKHRRRISFLSRD